MPAMEAKRSPELEVFERSTEMSFKEPRKMMHESNDVAFFLASKAYADILTFLLQLNASMFPCNEDQSTISEAAGEALPIKELQTMLSSLDSLIEMAPPDPGPRRFGNISFRKWYSLIESEIDGLLNKHLPPEILENTFWEDSKKSPLLELKTYLLGSFGSSQRLDYGTGHELSFLAFLGCIWKLGGFASVRSPGTEKAIVLGVVKPYLELSRRLIITYNLEPAGSHGVWGLDDHSFIPYVFGSAQLSPPIKQAGSVPTEGSLDNAPNPSDITKADVVERERHENMYFAAIGFIYDVKKGPFWEHSPMLYDISGVKDGWAKINKGMIKMYIAEVLSKFPVVQHFPFGDIFRWERDPYAPESNVEASKTSHSQSRQSEGTASLSGQSITQGTAAPWQSSSSMPSIATSSNRGPPGRQVPPLSSRQGDPSSTGSSQPASTRAPWAKGS